MPDMKAKLALVTGASRGLGEGVARALANQCKARRGARGKKTRRE